MLARSLGLQVTGLLGHFLDNGLLLVKALLGSGGEDTTGGSAKLTGNLLALGLGGVFLDSLLLVGTDLSWIGQRKIVSKKVC